MEIDEFSGFKDELTLGYHPMKNPVILTAITFGVGVFIGLVLACFGVRNTNFILFCAVFAGMLYTLLFKEVIPMKLRLKCGFYYFLMAIVICPILNLIWPGCIKGLSEYPLFMFFVIAPTEAVMFAALLHLGSFLEFKSLIPQH